MSELYNEIINDYKEQVEEQHKKILRLLGLIDHLIETKELSVESMDYISKNLWK